MFDEEEVTRLFKIYRTVMEMLRDREYVVEDVEVNISRSEFVKKMGDTFKREDLTILKTRQNNESEQIFVFFPDDLKIGVKNLRTYLDRMKADNVRRAILVARNPLTPSAKVAVREIASKFLLEVFLDEDLVVNIKNHIHVPEHQVLTPEEKKALLAQYNLKDAQLPRMRIIDPIARYYGLRVGQIVKIIRCEETAGRYVTYRIVNNM